MRSLRHPIRAIREPFGTAGLVIAMIALVAALGGSALAAKGALTGKQKKEVEKIAKKYAGKNGKTGAAGPAGPAGPAGKEGAKGANGTNGTDGVGSVGPQGPQGPQGEPGTTGFTETLPEGETETGAWTAISTTAQFEAGTSTITSIAFPIPLELPLSGSHVFFLKPEEIGVDHTAECPGSAAAPEAAPGDLCVYAAAFPGMAPFTASFGGPVQDPSKAPHGPQTAGAATSGALLLFAVEEEEQHVAYGTWAVTAPEE